MSHALVGLLAEFQTAPQDDEALQIVLADATAARALIHADPQAATTTLLAELPKVGDDVEKQTALFHLISEAGTPEGLAALRDVALVPMPASLANPDDTEREGNHPWNVMQLHLSAAHELGRSALSGNAAAKSALLEVAAGAPEVSIQVVAVDAYLAASPLRRRGKAELAEKLPASQRYLLHGSF